MPSSSNLKEIGSNENNTPDQKSIFCFSSSRTDVPFHGRSRQKLDPSQAVQIFPTSMTNADAFHSLPHVNKVPDLGGLQICSYTALQGQNTKPLKHRYTENIPLLHGPCISESCLLNLGYYFWLMLSKLQLELKIEEFMFLLYNYLSFYRFFCITWHHINYVKYFCRQ